MTELFELYEKSFRKNNDRIMSNFDTITLQPIHESHNDSSIKINKISLLEENDKLIEDQKKLIKQMEIVLPSLINNEYYEELNVKLTSFKLSIEINKNKVNDLYSKEEIKNSSFMSENNLLSEKNTILFNQERYKFQQNEKLQQVRRALSNTEEMGSNIMVNMDNQSKSMQNITGKLTKMGNNLQDSNTILNKMKSRSKKNKKIIIILTILFALILIGILSVKLYKKFK